MPAESTGDAELTELVANHVLRNKDFVEDFAVVHQKGLSDKLGDNSTPARPSFNGVPDVGISLPSDLEQELFVEIRSFF